MHVRKRCVWGQGPPGPVVTCNICLFFLFFRNNFYFHLTGPARTRPFLEEDLAGGEEGLRVVVLDLGMFC